MINALLAKQRHSAIPDKQRGVALVVGLVFLLITTLMAITAMSGVVMQERMAGNLRNASIAQAGADSAVRAGENWLRNFYSRGESLGDACSAYGGVFQRSTADDETGCVKIPSIEHIRTSKTWSETPGIGVHRYPTNLIDDSELDDPNAAGMARRPQFVIEKIGPFLPFGSGLKGEWEAIAGGDGGGSGIQDTAVYRVTGRSTGATENVIRVAESHIVGDFGGANAPAPTPPGPGGPTP